MRQVVDASYHQVWWPHHDDPVYDKRLPVWDEGTEQYVDPDTRSPLPTWDRALDAIDPEHEDPAHTIRPGTQLDYQGIIASDEREIARTIGYLTKYLTKSVAETYDPGTITPRQEAHRDRLHAELRWLPCTPQCSNWLRYGVQPKGAKAGMRPGECPKPAHELDNLGHGGRRVLVSRDWSGKKLSDHKADRAAVVQKVLAEAGIEMPDLDRYAADQTDENGQPRDGWEPLDVLNGDRIPAYRNHQGSSTGTPPLATPVRRGKAAARDPRRNTRHQLRSHQLRRRRGMTRKERRTSDKLLYRVSEAADVLGLGRSKTYALMQSGALRSVKIDGARRIRRDDLLTYVDSLAKAA